MGEPLTFRVPEGQPGGGTKQTADVAWDSDLLDEPPSFRTRWGHFDDDQPFVVRYATPGNDASEDLIENAVGIGLRMWRRYLKPGRYPLELARLLGYDMDRDEPCVLTAEYGMALGQLGRKLSPDDLRAFAGSLARGLHLLERLGVTHGRLSPAAIRWDQGTKLVQLTRFEFGSRTGDPRAALPYPWASPEQALGEGLASPKGDIFSAGCAILSLTARGLVRGPDGLPDPAATDLPWLPGLLAGVFGPEGQRPSAAQLLARLGRSDLPPDPPERDPELALETFRREFDELVRGKQPAAPKPPSPPPPPPSKPAREPGPTRRWGGGRGRSLFADLAESSPWFPGVALS